MRHIFCGTDETPSLPITGLSEHGLVDWLAGQEANIGNWVTGSAWEAEPGTICLIPGPDGAPAHILLGLDEEDGLWEYAAARTRLPGGNYRLEDSLAPDAAGLAALGWALGAYEFRRYKSEKKEKDPARLCWPGTCDQGAVLNAVEAIFLVRDLINTPAADMGPQQLAECATQMAEEFDAEIELTVGDELLAQGYPAIHAVGRASTQAPRLIDLRWGDEKNPKLTLVGKGVCFDSGGLNLKPTSGMKLMKKDMGGGAHALGLARMVMGAGLPVRLRLLVPAVENSVAGNAMRPLDIIETRKGLSIEIGNTDAEGRVILADALAEADSENPSLLIDMATLTGAARVALGTELPALFCNHDDWAESLLQHGKEADDPLWRLPLWKGYRKQLESPLADLTNAPEGGFGGAITAALFLEEFISSSTRWAHLDLMAWNGKSSPGRPEGGEALGIRAIFDTIKNEFDADMR